MRDHSILILQRLAWKIWLRAIVWSRVILTVRKYVFHEEIMNLLLMHRLPIRIIVSINIKEHLSLLLLFTNLSQFDNPIFYLFVVGVIGINLGSKHH